MARKKSQANYFTKETEDYIVLYNNSDDIEYKNRIFTDHIYFPFYKLAENIIHTFKFYYTDVDQIEDLKHEIVSVLLEEKISKFNPALGAKAYSYFGTIVKRWLINYNNKNYKKLKQIGTLNDMEETLEDEIDLETPSNKSLSKFLDEWVEEMYDELEEHFDKEIDIKVADAILTIFKTRQDIDIFKKKALYIYIREMTDCDTPILTKVINTLKANWYKKYQRYYDLGLLSNNSL